MKHAFLHEEETRKALSQFILKTERFSMDAECAKFERAFAAYQKQEDAVLVSSGSAANLGLLQALKNLGRLGASDTIGFSALTWATNVMPIIQLGFEPVPIDCELGTLNVSPRTLEQRLETCELKALFITNVLGFTDDLSGVRDLCRAHGILLIEDNCESLGTELPQGKTGTFGLAATFSFYIAHPMSTIEGGMVTTDDAELAEMLRLVRAHGWDRNLTPGRQKALRARHGASDFSAKYLFYDLSYNLRPTEITGFLGNFQLQFLEESIGQRAANFARVEMVVAKNPDFSPISHRHITRLSPFAFPFVCTSAGTQARYLSRLADAGVEVRPIIAGNMQRQPFYVKWIDAAHDLPNTDHIHGCGFYSGNYPELSEDDISQIIDALLPAA